MKPPRGLTKQKATVSLKNVPEQPTRIMPKRKSAEKSAEPMDMSSKNEDAKVSHMCYVRLVRYKAPNFLSLGQASLISPTFRKIF